MRPLTAWLEHGYCSITVANYGLLKLIRFVTQSCTRMWKKFANRLHLVLHASKIIFCEFFLGVTKHGELNQPKSAGFSHQPNKDKVGSRLGLVCSLILSKKISKQVFCVKKIDASKFKWKGLFSERSKSNRDYLINLYEQSLPPVDPKIKVKHIVCGRP